MLWSTKSFYIFFVHLGGGVTSFLTPAPIYDPGSANWHLVHMYLYPKKNFVLFILLPTILGCTVICKNLLLNAFSSVSNVFFSKCLSS